MLDFTTEEEETVAAVIALFEDRCRQRGIRLPDMEEVIFVRTTMAEEGDAAAYTHGTQVYLGEWILSLMGMEEEGLRLKGATVFAHELFHCITRCNPAFRTDMYDILGFTVEEEDYVFPDEVKRLLISNPDVHHNAHATFVINGEAKECVVVYGVPGPFEKKGDDMLALGQIWLLPVDDLSEVYLREEADNFDEVFGRNTGYVIDPEETLADNFSYAVIDGLEGRAYENPEIIEKILVYLTQ